MPNDPNSIVPFPQLEASIKSEAETSLHARLLLRVLAHVKRLSGNFADVENEVDDKADDDTVTKLAEKLDNVTDHHNRRLKDLEGGTVDVKKGNGPIEELCKNASKLRGRVDELEDDVRTEDDAHAKIFARLTELTKRFEKLGSTNGGDWRIRGDRLAAVEKKVDEFGNKLVKRVIALEGDNETVDRDIREHAERLIHVEDDLANGRECLDRQALVEERVDVFTAEVIDSLAPLDEFNLRLTALEAGSLGTAVAKVPGTIFRCECGERVCDPGKVCPECKKAVTKSPPKIVPGRFIDEAQFKCGDCDKRFDNITDAGRHVCAEVKATKPKIVSVNHPRFAQGTVFSCEECGARSDDASFVNEHDCDGCVHCARKLRDDGLCPVCDGDAIVEKLSLTCVVCECPVDFDDEGGLCRNPSCPAYLEAQAEAELDEGPFDRVHVFGPGGVATTVPVRKPKKCQRCGANYNLTSPGETGTESVFCRDSRGCLARREDQKSQAEREADARVERDHVIEKASERRWSGRVKALEDQVEALREDLEAEREGERSLRRDYGSKPSETMRGFVARLRRERDEAVDGEPAEEAPVKVLKDEVEALRADNRTLAHSARSAEDQRQERLMSLGAEGERRKVLVVLDEQIKEFTATLEEDDNRDKVDALVGIPILEGVRATVFNGEHR